MSKRYELDLSTWSSCRDLPIIRFAKLVTSKAIEEAFELSLRIDVNALNPDLVEAVLKHIGFACVRSEHENVAILQCKKVDNPSH